MRCNSIIRRKNIRRQRKLKGIKDSLDKEPMSDSRLSDVSPPPASSSSVGATTDGSSTGTSTPSRGRRERPCDVCRRRKSRCVMLEGNDTCEFCRFHNQDCTFLQSPQPRKKRTPAPTVTTEGGAPSTSGKKRARPSADPPSPPSTVSNRKDSMSGATEQTESEEEDEEEDDLTPDGVRRRPLASASYSHGICLGLTSEYESALIGLCPFNDDDEYKLPYNSDDAIFRQASDAATFLMFPSKSREHIEEEASDHEAVEMLVKPYGPTLVDLYFRVVHPSFPILLKSQFSDRNRPSPLLLAAVFLFSLKWWEHDQELAGKTKPDALALENLATKLFISALQFPQLHTVQAGLLLLQRTNPKSWLLTSQVVALGQELGLHLDCSRWRIPRWEKGLRKRLAWGIYMQDKWTALTQGRPSHISLSNWGVKHIVPRDFAEEDGSGVGVGDGEGGGDEDYRGRMLFTQMIELSQITAEVLDGFFTVERINRFGQVEDIEHVLERAKPVQIKLKEWFARLPECLKMDSTQTSSFNSNGYLHVGYFATEITLHRAIIRSLDTSKSPYLVHICRTAAKTRLISAMDFVNRLKPEHLRAFWYAASTVSFALIGTFGTLLWATSQAALESEFYKARLDEYRWTLLVSSKGADFMRFAVRAMDSSAAYCMESVASANNITGSSSNDAILPAFKDMAFKSPLKKEGAEAAMDRQYRDDYGVFEDDDGAARESLRALVALSTEGKGVGSSSRGKGSARRRNEDEMHLDPEP